MDGTGDLLISDGDAGTAEGYLKFDSSGTFELKTAAITFETDGTITSQDYLLERTRMFGAGNDGTVSIGGTTTLGQDMYYDNLTVTGTLKTNGYRVYVKGTLNNSGTIECRGVIGGSGINNTSGATGGAGGAGGVGANSGTLGGGATGGTGGIGGLGYTGGATDGKGGAGGGGGGGSSGIMFISCKELINTGTISVKGADGGQGGWSIASE
jgi:hypothetical protein